ncbi:MAG TPA: hypothetical protein VHV77_08480, partial [Pirellulales bacterium]|nr:hypothetical protein [Pirellulales bacterium]
FVMALVCWTVSAIARLDLLLGQRNVTSVMIEQGLELCGHLLLVVSMWLHARYVVRDAQGLVPAKATKSTSKKATETKAGASTSAAGKRSDLASPPKAAPSAASAAATRARLEQQDEDDEEEEFEDRGGRRDRPRHRVDDEHEDGSDRKLSKTDRKALRRAKEQQRRYET